MLQIVDEDATKFYISMCLNGEGGPKMTPELYIKQVANSNDPSYENYSDFYGRILANKGEYYYYEALHYLDRAGTAEARELASKIRDYFEAKRRAEEARREAERREDERNSGSSLGFLALGALPIGLAFAPVSVQIGAFACAIVLGGSRDDDSD